MDTVYICCTNNNIFQKIEYSTIIDLSHQLKSVINDNHDIQLTLNNIILNKFNIINNSILSKISDTDIIKIIFNQEDNKSNILKAVKNDIDTLLHISDDLKNDKEFMIACVKENVKSLLHISDDLKNDKEFILTCIKENGLSLEYASDDLKNDIEIVLYAVLQDKLALKFASIELKNKIKIIEKSSIPRLQCIYCKKFYKSIKTKSFHMKSCKLDYPEIIIVNNRDICRYCNKKFNCTITAYRHEKICNQKQITTINKDMLNNNSNNNNSINSSNNTTKSSNDNITNNITNITQNFNFKNTD